MMQRFLPVCAAALMAAGVAGPSGARAEDAGAAPPSSIWEQSSLFGDIGGLRPALGRQGISFGLQETSEALGNVTGGTRRALDYEGVTEMSVGLDTAAAFGWRGGTFNVSALQIHGRNLSTDALGVLDLASGIEAERATRLWELWFQQTLFDGLADVKIGVQSLDQEFMVSQYGGLFVNAMFGWPALPSYDLYGGGPAYPLASPGVRLRLHPSQSVTLLAGAFADNPSGASFFGNAQRVDASGTNFSLAGGVLWIAELQYARGGGTDEGASLPGTYRVGLWYDSGAFPSRQYDSQGIPLASPASAGVRQMRQGNASAYAVVDQTVWKPAPASPRGLGVFARALGAPNDRNLIDLAANAGLVMRAPLAGRENDSAGIGLGYTQVGASVSAHDRQVALFSNTPGYPVRSAETYAELTYQLQLTPWWQLQPDFQYVFNPGAGVPNPRNPGKRLGDEAILGLRTVVTF